MEWQDIETALARLEPPFPRAAAEEARQRWDELAPRFVAAIERVANGGSIFRDEMKEEYDGIFSFALYLAAEKRDARAYAPLLRACHCSPERAGELFGDDVGSAVGRVLASVCDGDLAPLKALAEDGQAAMWCRYAALHAMAVRVVEGDGSRDELLVYLDAFCECEADVMRRDEWDFEREPCDLLTWAADTACDIGPAPLLEKIRGWMAEGLIDPTVTGINWYEKNAAKSAADCLADAAEDKNNRYIQDGIAQLEPWICFDTDDAGNDPEFWEDEEGHAPPLWGREPARHGDTFIREAPKVGRNDPCPCGSGKKFKKCCGKAGAEPAAEDDDASGVRRALDWLLTRHGKAVAAATNRMITGNLDEAEMDVLRSLAEEDWRFIQINAFDWLLAEGEIHIKGAYRYVPDLLLGPGGPLFTAGQRRWIEQLTSRPLRLYDITDVQPGVGMTLCDALDTDAAPVTVREISGSRDAQVGTQIGARLMEVHGHYELSGAAYPISRLTSPGLVAELREDIAECLRRGDDLRRTVSFAIRRHWLAQYVKPLPLPTVIDSHSGDLLLLITDHYRVKDWDVLARHWKAKATSRATARRAGVASSIAMTAHGVRLPRSIRARARTGSSFSTRRKPMPTRAGRGSRRWPATPSNSPGAPSPIPKA
jgi:hypothetical protein